MFVHLRDADAPDPRHAEAVARARRGRPPDDHAHRAPAPSDLGRIFFFAEFATAVAGWALEINPFDQPDVQEAKDNTARVLERAARPGPPGRLARRSCSTGSPRRRTWRSWATCRTTTRSTRRSPGCARALIERHGVATTFGYGPRFLHSTGQFHKGGPPTGRFLQLVHDAGDDLDVPGQPYSFRTLIDAQADGDLQTLRDHGLPAARVRLPAGDLAGAITRLQEQL